MKGGTRNIETFKVGSGRTSESDRQKNQGASQSHHGNQPEPGVDKVQTKAERLAEVMKQAHEKVLKRKNKR
jgi:hypothetical protein